MQRSNGVRVERQPNSGSDVMDMMKQFGSQLNDIQEQMNSSEQMDAQQHVQLNMKLNQITRKQAEYYRNIEVTYLTFMKYSSFYQYCF